MIVVFHHCGLFTISNGILVFLGNQLVYLYRPTRKYTYQIIIYSNLNLSARLIPGAAVVPPTTGLWQGPFKRTKGDLILELYWVWVIPCILRANEESCLSLTGFYFFKRCHLCLFAYIAFELDSITPLHKNNCFSHSFYPFLWSSHLARHCIKSVEGWEIVLYSSHFVEDKALLASNKEDAPLVLLLRIKTKQTLWSQMFSIV